MNATGSPVDFQEALSVKVGQFLLAKGYGLAENTGYATSSLNQSNELGILLGTQPFPPVQLPTFFGLCSRTSQPRRPFLGIIWFANRARGANGQHWVLEIFGRQSVGQMQQLATEMAEKFTVKISLVLVSEELRPEALFWDFDQ